MRVYFDANIWIDYAWGFFNESKKIKDRIEKLINKIESKNIDVVISSFVNAEISNHLKDWILMQKSIEDGFSYRQFSSIKKNYKLTGSEIKKIDKIIKQILEINWVTIIEEESLDANDLNVFTELSSQHSLDSIDAIHGIMAAKTNCRYIITNDKPFFEQLNHALKENNLLDKFSAIKSNEFVNLK